MTAVRGLARRLRSLYVRALVACSDDTGAIKEGLGYILITLFVLTMGLALVNSVSSHQDSIWQILWQKITDMFNKITVS